MQIYVKIVELHKSSFYNHNCLQFYQVKYYLQNVIVIIIII